jgi:mRNA interferase MazF
MLVKARIHRQPSTITGLREREVWICNIGENVGFEEDGKGSTYSRPVLVLKVFHRRFCCVLPLSTTPKRGRYYFPFESGTGKMSVALLSQIRSIDTARLRRKIGVIDEAQFRILKSQLVKILSLE